VDSGETQRVYHQKRLKEEASQASSLDSVLEEIPSLVKSKNKKTNDAKNKIIE